MSHAGGWSGGRAEGGGDGRPGAHDDEQADLLREADEVRDVAVAAEVGLATLRHMPAARRWPCLCGVCVAGGGAQPQERTGKQDHNSLIVRNRKRRKRGQTCQFHGT